MAQQFSIKVYQLNNQNLAAAVDMPVPSAKADIRDASDELKVIGSTRVYSVVRWDSAGTPQKAYCSNTVASLVTAANA